MLSIVFFVLSIIPSVLIIKWMMGRRTDDPQYAAASKSALKKGLISVLPIIGVSAVLALAKRILESTILKGLPDLTFEALNTFIVLAFAEELVKFTMLKSVLKKEPGPYTWADITAFMVIIGTAFGLIEDIPYAIGASPVVMLIRGATMGHVGYGFMMGWLYGKGLYTGDSKFKTMAFVLPFLLHGLYDFSLTPDLLKINDNLAFIGISLALMDVILLVLMIRFFIRSKNIDKYNEPLPSLE